MSDISFGVSGTVGPIADPVNLSDAANRGWVLNQILSGSVTSASYALNSTNASFATSSLSSSYSLTSTNATNAFFATSSLSSSYALNSTTASFATSSLTSSIALSLVSVLNQDLTINGNFVNGFGTFVNNGNYAHAEGFRTTASGQYTHAEGYQTIAFGEGSHAEGSNTFASGSFTHAEGNINNVNGNYSHGEGYLNTITVNGTYGHVEGQSCVVDAVGGHAEGLLCNAYGKYSHVQGYNNYADCFAHNVMGNSNVRCNNNTGFGTTTGSVVIGANGTNAFVTDGITQNQNVRVSGLNVAKLAATAGATYDNGVGLYGNILPGAVSGVVGFDTSGNLTNSTIGDNYSWTKTGSQQWAGNDFAITFDTVDSVNTNFVGSAAITYNSSNGLFTNATNRRLHIQLNSEVHYTGSIAMYITTYGNYNGAQAQANRFTQNGDSFVPTSNQVFVSKLNKKFYLNPNGQSNSTFQIVMWGSGAIGTFTVSAGSGFGYSAVIDLTLLN